MLQEHSASEQRQQENILKGYAIVQRIGGKNEDYENLQSLIEEGKSQNKQLEEFVMRSHQASEQARELKRSDKNQILRFYELVQQIGRVYG
jgi:hypothetical protein